MSSGNTVFVYDKQVTLNYAVKCGAGFVCRLTYHSIPGHFRAYLNPGQPEIKILT